MITLYSKATSNGRKASIMLEESGLDYTVRPMALEDMEQKEDWYLAINPNGRIPCIVDDDGPGGQAVTVFESGAILIYLAEKSGRLLPADPAARMEALELALLRLRPHHPHGAGRPLAGPLPRRRRRARPPGRMADREQPGSTECSTAASKDGTTWPANTPSRTSPPTPGSTGGGFRRSTSTAMPTSGIGWRASATGRRCGGDCKSHRGTTGYSVLRSLPAPRNWLPRPPSKTTHILKGSTTVTPSISCPWVRSSL